MRFVFGIISALIVCTSPRALALQDASSSAAELDRPRTPSSGGFKSRSVGHLVTSNTQTLKQNEISLGTLYAGIGLTDEWMIVVSPFVIGQYEMANAQIRWGREIGKQKRVGLDLAYFKTFGAKAEVDQKWEEYCALFDDCGESKHPIGFASFKMEAAVLKLSVSEMLGNWYRASVTGGYYYYFDDERPFSLRMDPQNNDPYAISLTTLNEFRMSETNYLNIEAGFWGLNYTYPYYHLGLSYSYQGDSYLLGLGLSHTFSPQFPREKSRAFAGYESGSSTHPEVQIQAFF